MILAQYGHGYPRRSFSTLEALTQTERATYSVCRGFCIGCSMSQTSAWSYWDPCSEFDMYDWTNGGGDRILGWLVEVGLSLLLDSGGLLYSWDGDSRHESLGGCLSE